MKLELSQKTAELLDRAMRAACMRDEEARDDVVALYRSIPPAELSKLCHDLHEIAYGEEFAQQGAMAGKYQPDRFKAID